MNFFPYMMAISLNDFFDIILGFVIFFVIIFFIKHVTQSKVVYYISQLINIIEIFQTIIVFVKFINVCLYCFIIRE